MSMAIYTKASPGSAIAEFGQPLSAPTFLDGAFVVLERAVLCFLVTGPEGPARLETPRQVVWRGRTEPPAEPSNLGWWPSAVVDVYDRTGPTTKRLRQHQLFLRSEQDSDFLYAGPAHLGSYGTDRVAHFELNTALPRPLWLRFGGYSGWMIELQHERRTIEDGDETSLDISLAAFASRAFSHLSLTRYEEDALHLYKNERCAWLMYLREPADSGVYVERDAVQEAAAEEHFRCDCGIDLEFPLRQTLSVPEALDIARLLFRHGALPTGWRWTD